MSDTINLLVLEGDGISPEITAATLNADYAVAQAQHGSAPDTAGQNVANPSSLIGSAAMPLAWLGEGGGDDDWLVKAAQGIETALDSVIADPATRTPDMGGTLGTDAFADKVANAVTAGVG
ncbi:MAG: isocitrate/isopropylmalate family dehydrogenase [Pseudolabrys sp.]